MKLGIRHKLSIKSIDNYNKKKAEKEMKEITFAILIPPSFSIAGDVLKPYRAGESLTLLAYYKT